MECILGDTGKHQAIGEFSSLPQGNPFPMRFPWSLSFSAEEDDWPHTTGIVWLIFHQIGPISPNRALSARILIAKVSVYGARPSPHKVAPGSPHPLARYPLEILLQVLMLRCLHLTILKLRASLPTDCHSSSLVPPLQTRPPRPEPRAPPGDRSGRIRGQGAAKSEE